ncbi:MAG: FtsQ-type POTRA domain-containing protein [bacterium]
MSVFLERQQVQKKRQWTRRLRQIERGLIAAAVVIAGLVCLYGLYRIIFLGSTFNVKRIVAEGNWHYLTADGVAALSGVNEGDNLFWVSVSDVYKKLRTEPWVKKAAVRRRLPNTLWIYVEEFRPAAIIAADALYYVDAEGDIVKKVEPGEEKDFPVITGIPVTDGTTLASSDATRVGEMLGIIEKFRATRIGGEHDIAEMHYDEVNGYSIMTRREPMQILIGQSDLQERISQIDRMSSAIEARAGRIQYMMANEDGRIIVRYRPS